MTSILIYLNCIVRGTFWSRFQHFVAHLFILPLLLASVFRVYSFNFQQTSEHVLRLLSIGRYIALCAYDICNCPLQRRIQFYCSRSKDKAGQDRRVESLLVHSVMSDVASFIIFNRELFFSIWEKGGSFVWTKRNCREWHHECMPALESNRQWLSFGFFSPFLFIVCSKTAS